MEKIQSWKATPMASSCTDCSVCVKVFVNVKISKVSTILDRVVKNIAFLNFA